MLAILCVHIWNNKGIITILYKLILNSHLADLVSKGCNVYVFP